MKTAWVILIISAFTDGIITAVTGLTTAMAATGQVEMPNQATLIISLLGGVATFARTIQQGLKNTPETSAALRGDRSIVETNTISKTP